MSAHIVPAFWRRQLVRVLLLVVIGGAVGGVAAQLAPRSYASTARVYVSTSSSSSPTLLEAQHFVQQATASFADVATTPLVLNRTISRLGLATTPSELARHVSADAAAGTALIAIRVSDPSAARSARIANGISAALVAESSQLTPSGPNSAPLRLTSVSAARASSATSDPDLLAFIGLGAVAGLVVALVVLVLGGRRPKPPRGSWRLVWVPKSPGEPA